MKNEVFITATASFFPNNPIDNNSIEDYLGLISGQHSRVKNLVLRQNGIKNRYYALNTKQEMTHTNAELAVNSINRLLSDKNLNEKSIELLSCATANADGNSEALHIAFLFSPDLIAQYAIFSA